MPEIAWIGRRPGELPAHEPRAVPVASIEFCEAMAAQFPDLGMMLTEHREYFGETLPHVFFGDVTRWYMERYQAGDSLIAKALVDWFDAVYPTADESAKNVLDVSFLENLPWPPDPDAVATELLGPNLRRSLEEMQAWRPDSD